MLVPSLSKVPDLVVHEEEIYEDEDDENEEGNWRNDYPDESGSDSGQEERFGGMYCQLRQASDRK